MGRCIKHSLFDELFNWVYFVYEEVGYEIGFFIRT
jgi:hypothetical protein